MSSVRPIADTQLEKDWRQYERANEEHEGGNRDRKRRQGKKRRGGKQGKE